MNKLAIVTLLVLMFSMSAAAVNAGTPRNLPPVANNDEVTLFRPVQTVDVPVLDNDYDPEGRALRVVGLTVLQGGRAVIAEGKAIKVYIDPLPVNGEGPSAGLVAHGAYIVSDGLLESKAEWFVYYRPGTQY